MVIRILICKKWYQERAWRSHFCAAQESIEFQNNERLMKSRYSKMIMNNEGITMTIWENRKN
ncbi:hypothetical protein [Clostridium sp. YIM B02555]|uniref:hypothetical protein n=1 Tax=Clostridium sp. YIM B02555 TaxID=2911968 RepID=UPI001EED46CA|nr:hypothetical protein [Clostridium sp. YIM B02555]